MPFDNIITQKKGKKTLNGLWTGELQYLGGSRDCSLLCGRMLPQDNNKEYAPNERENVRSRCAHTHVMGPA